MVVGADGWFSNVREQLLGDGPPTFKDAIVFRARMQRPTDGSIITEHRTKWWVPPGGPSAGNAVGCRKSIVVY
jgi:2-polyprenyl-6-methoxyphenol hydroxylase-like FAD-dependent oxidoreductase